MAPNFRRGGEAAQEAAKSGGRFDSVGYFSLGDGQHQAVRFISDEPDWITVTMHNSVPTRPAPAGYKGKWPAVTSAVCRRDKGFEGAFSDCFICDNIRQQDGKPWRKSEKTWGLLILREEVLVNGKLTSLKDTLKEVAVNADPESKETKQVPDIRVATMSYSNFWGGLLGMIAMQGTLRNLDYRVSRTGAGMNDTTYSFAPYPPMGVVVNGQTVQFDLNVKEFMDNYDIPDLAELVADKAGDEYYHLFFDTRFPQPSRGNTTTPSGPASAPPPVNNDVDPAKMAALADRIQGYGAQQTPQPQPVGAMLGDGAPAPGVISGGGFLNG